MPLKTHLAPESLVGLFLTYIVTGLVLGLLGVYSLLYWVFESNTEIMVRDGLYGQAEEIAEEIRFDANGNASLVMHEPMQWAYDAFFANLKYRVLTPQGELLLASDDARGPLLPPQANSLQEAPDYFILARPDGDLHVAGFAFSRNGRDLFIQTARSDRFSDLAAEAIMPAVFETAGILAGGALIILTVALLLAVRAAITRVHDVSRAADLIKPENLEARLDVNRAPREIVPLVDAFNRALDRISEAYRVQQRFVANAAHELKTPLTIMRSQVDLNTSGTARERLLADIDFMARNVQQMLHLSQVQDINNYRFEAVNLGAIAAEVRTAFDDHPARAGRRIEIQGESAVNVLADRSAMFTAMRNLVENAIKWTPANGTVVIDILPHGFAVEDDGPGIDPASWHLLFERFWRANASTSDGSGLGLSIVAEIARAHGGRARAENRMNRKGACFTVLLNPQRRII
jgi:signal transduction histidine kinase